MSCKPTVSIVPVLKLSVGFSQQQRNNINGQEVDYTNISNSIRHKVKPPFILKEDCPDL